MFIFDRGVRTSKTFTLKLIIQGLLQLYNKNISSDLTKTKVLFMTSIGKVAFNIDNLIIHLALNIPIQQSLFILLNLSSDSLNRLTCRYEQLRFLVIDEISFIGAIMFNVIDNRLRSLKHIQKKFFGGVHGIMTCEFYQTPLLKDNWMFQNIKENVNALTPKFCQTYT
jgi:hypothetical protein